MGDLSANFSRREFACRCGCGFDAIDPRLVALLQGERTDIGRPIRINSGCRCEPHNRREGGSPTSQHLAGRAADIRVPGIKLAQLYHRLEAVPALRNGGIGLYPFQGFIHVDLRGTRARWGWLPHVGKVSIWEALARSR